VPVSNGSSPGPGSSDGGDDLGGPPASRAELDALEERISGWLAAQLEENPVLVAVDRGEPGERRWYVRLAGEDKDFSTIWFTLRQRSLHFETYVMPAPEDNQADFYAHLLRRNLGMRGMAFAVGAEEAVFLMGSLPVTAVDEGQLDRIVGSMYAYVEQFFRPALRLGFASRLGLS
jgi:hypothetical protein